MAMIFSWGSLWSGSQSPPLGCEVREDVTLGGCQDFLLNILDSLVDGRSHESVFLVELPGLLFLIFGDLESLILESVPFRYFVGSVQSLERLVRGTFSIESHC